MIRKTVLTLIAAFSLVVSAYGQDAIEEKERLAIGVEHPIGIENENAARTLTNNITQALILNGLSATESRFTVIPKVALLSMNVTGTTPSKFVVELDVSLFLGDLYTGVLMGQTSFSVKGVGNSEGQAYINAIRNVQARNSKLKTMIITGKDKIMSYFDANGEQILGRVQAHITRTDYLSAMIEAMAIPVACADLYNKASELIAQIPYEKKKDIVVTPTIINNFFYQEPREDRITIFVK